MKIDKIETLVVDDGGPMMLVVVHTDDGLYGLGEVGLRSRQYAVRGALEHFEELIIGQDPFDTEHLWQVLSRSGFYPADRVLASAISAIDIALWDIKGKALGVPVYQLLGGATRDYVQCYAHVSGGSPEQLLERVGQLRADGWSVLRTSAVSQGPKLDPRTAVRDTLNEFALIKETYGDIELIVDVHTRLGLPDATTLCAGLEEFNPYFVEDALRWENVDLYRMLRSRSRVPLAAGEHAASKWEMRTLVEENLIDYARFDLCNVGGITEAKKIAGWCEVHDIGIATHNPLGPIATAASFHLNLSTPNFGIQEQYQLPGTAVTDIISPQMIMSGDQMLIPTDPGLGIEIDLEKARSSQASFRAIPQLRRPDGSFTNW